MELKNNHYCSGGFHIIVPIWGKSYVDKFLQFSLPAMLSKGNLGSSFYDHDLSGFHIYTTSADAETIQNSSVFKKLNDIIIAKIHTIDDIVEPDLFFLEKMTICHDLGTKECGEKDAAILLTADMVFADGAFKKMYEIAMTGKKVILSWAVRSDGNVLMRELLKHYSETELSITISNRELAKLACENLHPYEARPWGMKCPLIWKPPILRWDIPGKGLLFRSRTLFPLLVVSEKGDAPVYIPDKDNRFWTTDGDYVERLCPNFDRIHIVEDSDEMFMATIDDFHLSGDDSHAYSVLHHADVLIEDFYKPYQLKTKIRFHFEDLSPEWEAVEKESDKVVDEILACVDLFDKFPNALEGFRQLKAERDNSIQQFYRLRMEAVMACNTLGIEFHKTGRAQEAEAAMQKSLALFPHQMPAHRNLAVIYINNREWEKAFAHTQIAIQMAPGQTELWNLIVGILHNHGIHPQIVEWLRQVAHLIPDDPGILNALSQIGLKHKNLELIELVFSKSQSQGGGENIENRGQQSDVDLRKNRKQLADYWVSLPNDQLEKAYMGDMGDQHRRLMESDLQNEALTQEENAFLQTIVTELTKQSATDPVSAINYLLAAMLYIPPDRLKIENAAGLPKWLIGDYERFFEERDIDKDNNISDFNL